MLLGMMVVGTSAASYADVSSKNNLEAIEVLKAVGIMTGDDKGNFNPDKMVTRNEMAVVMCNLLGLKTGGNHPFTDVPAWAAPYVAACYNNNIIAGVSATQFNGDANVTAVQAGLMVMKALGYFGYAGEFGDNWKLSVVKQANKIDLYAGINAYTDQDMTRNDVAQLVLNGLQSTVMVVEQIGGLTVDGNGITVVEKPTYKYTAAENKSGKDYADARDEYNSELFTMQLAEKLYGNELKKDNDTADKFGRPATLWTYDDERIVSPKAAVATYTKAVKGGDIYKDLGKPSATITVDYNEDGDNQGSAPAGLSIASGNETEVGGKGVLTEVYYNKDTEVTTIVCINTYFGEIAKATPAKGDDKATVTVTGYDKYETDAFDVEDKVLFTKIGTEIQSMVLAKVADAGKVTGKNNTKNTFIVNGTTYDYAASVASTNYVNVKDEVDIYLDAYGYVIHTEETKGAEAQYAVVLGTKTDGFSDSTTNYAKIVLADGTIAEVEYKLADGVSLGDGLANNLVSYTVKDKVYTFKTATAGSTVTKITKGAAELADDVYANSKTVFIVRSGEVGDYEYTAYTGIKNVPSQDKDATLTAKAIVDTEIAKLVYVTVGTEAGSEASKPIFVLGASKTDMVDADDESYYVYNAVVDGKITTVESTKDNLDGLYKKVTYNADGQITVATPADADKKGAATGTTKAKDGLIVFTAGTNAGKYSFADDVKVFVIDSDNEIAESSINVVAEDTNDTVVFAMDKNGIITAIYITEVAD